MSSFQKIATARPLASLVTVGAIAAVMVLSTMSSAWAADAPPAASSASQQTSTPDRDPPTGTHIRSNPKDLAPIVVYPGAVHGAGDAQWTDDDASAPELPMTRE